MLAENLSEQKLPCIVIPRKPLPSAPQYQGVAHILTYIYKKGANPRAGDICFWFGSVEIAADHRIVDALNGQDIDLILDDKGKRVESIARVTGNRAHTWSGGGEMPGECYLLFFTVLQDFQSSAI